MDNTPNVLYKGPLHQKIEQTLFLLFHCNHYDVILSPGIFFYGSNSKKKFCVDCKLFYEKAIFHRLRCSGE